jgi:hypothetical protein
VRFSNLPLTEALARLLADVNFAIVERRGPGGVVRRTLIVFRDPARRASQGSVATAGAPLDDGGAARHLDALYQAAGDGDLKLLGRAAADPADPSQAAALDLLRKRIPPAPCQWPSPGAWGTPRPSRLAIKRHAGRERMLKDDVG